MKSLYYSLSETNTEEIGAEIASEIGKNDYIAFFGDLGSGKTAFMRGFVSKLIPNAMVTSPTYALVNVYENNEYTVNHFDMYRISSEDDLISTGYYDMIENGITCVEWSEKITFALPEHYIKITFEKISNVARKLHVERI